MRRLVPGIPSQHAHRPSTITGRRTPRQWSSPAIANPTSALRTRAAPDATTCSSHTIFLLVCFHCNNHRGPSRGTTRGVPFRGMEQPFCVRCYNTACLQCRAPLLPHIAASLHLTQHQLFSPPKQGVICMLATATLVSAVELLAVPANRH